MAGFSEHVWDAVSDIRRSIDDHPFLAGLEDGTLPRQVFTGYLAQDAHYLSDYARVLASCATQSRTADDLVFWAGSAQQAVLVERSLHTSHVTDLDRHEKSPTCTAYTSFLLGLAAGGSYPVLVAGVLPCYWIYEDVGRRLRERVGDLSGHPYGDWIGTYGDPAFAASTATARTIVDRVASESGEATVRRMTEAFITASRHEWLFWDAAWRQEAWPV